MLNTAVTKRLASTVPRWHERVMSGPPPPRIAGGILLAVGILGGVAIGGALRQPSIGFLAGLAAGLLGLGVVWLAERRHQR